MRRLRRCRRPASVFRFRATRGQASFDVGGSPRRLADRCRRRRVGDSQSVGGIAPHRDERGAGPAWPDAASRRPAPRTGGAGAFPPDAADGHLLPRRVRRENPERRGTHAEDRRKPRLGRGPARARAVVREDIRPQSPIPSSPGIIISVSPEFSRQAPLRRGALVSAPHS